MAKNTTITDGIIRSVLFSIMTELTEPLVCKNNTVRAGAKNEKEVNKYMKNSFARLSSENKLSPW
ncbi:hypothetical protein D3C86_1921210 [compost metagenome]